MIQTVGFLRTILNIAIINFKNMKKLTIILTGLIAFWSCKAQDVNIKVDTSCYSQEYLDSSLSIKDAVINSMFTPAYVDSLILIIKAKDEQIQAQAKIYGEFFSVNGDTTSFKFSNGECSATISSIDSAHYNYQLIDGDYRINIWYNRGVWETYFMYNSKTLLYQHGQK